MSLQKAQAMTPEEPAATRRRLDESGPPACVEAYALRAAATRASRIGDEDAGLGAITALLEHQHGCAVCRADPEYVKAHGPPNPRDTPWGLRVLELVERLLRFLLGPSPELGEYRRFGAFVAVFLSAAVAVGIGANALLAALLGKLDAAGLRERGALLAVVVPGYVAGFWLAGAAWDATRRIRHRPLGYLLRGGATAAAVYGAVGLVMWPVDDGFRDERHPVIAMVMLMAVLGVLVGAGKWIKDLLTNNVPVPVRPPDEPFADAG